MNKNLIKLINKTIQKQVVGLLLSKGYVNLKDYKNNKVDPEKDYRFSNLSMTSSGRKLIDAPDLNITKEWLSKYISVYNPNYKSNKDSFTLNESTIIKKITNFIEANPEITLDDILKAYTSCVIEKGKFARKPEYFIYKKVDGDIISQLEDYLNNEVQKKSTWI